MHKTAPSGFSQQTFEAFLDSRGEPGWVSDARRAAWERFESLAWPGRSEEKWSRTDIRMFKLDRFALPTGDTTVESPPPALLNQSVQLAGQATNLNGQSLQAELAAKWAEQGVLFGPLSQLLAEYPDQLRAYCPGTLRDHEEDKFAALHNACWTGGSVLYVPRGVTVDEPLHALTILGDQRADLGHTLVVLEPGAEATLMCEMRGIDESSSGLHCGGMQLDLQQGSCLRLVGLQDWGRETWHFAHQVGRVAQDASLQWTVAAMGSRLTKVSQTVELTAPGANCQVNGVLFTEGKQHIAYDTLQHHRAAQCHSDFLYKGALQDRSRTVWRGMIKVDPQAQQTDAYQRNDNLLLGSSVRADSIPGLEIEADDVRCSHGSTSGRVDEELIFYCQCRGFTRSEAIRAIVSGFFQQIFDRITIDSVRDALSEAIARRVREYE